MMKSDLIGGKIIVVVQKDMGNAGIVPLPDAIVELVLPAAGSFQFLMTNGSGEAEFDLEQVGFSYLLRVSFGAQQMQRTDYLPMSSLSDSATIVQKHTFIFFHKTI